MWNYICSNINTTVSILSAVAEAVLITSRIAVTTGTAVLSLVIFIFLTQM